MTHNVLRDPLITINVCDGRSRSVSLPELFAAMTCQEVAGFAALRPHQHSCWHMFLVQLAVLAGQSAKQLELPEDSESWETLLRALTPDFGQDEPWRLIVNDSAVPAFLQPPDPGGLKWKQVVTADDLDLLITAKNFDLKQSMANDSRPEDWLFALMSLQTMAGYLGRGSHGIARMNKGASSRPLLGLAPGSGNDMTVSPSAWWKRDVNRLLHAPSSPEESTPGGPGLLWCLPWPEGEQLQVQELDPLFIEVCRRVRLEQVGERIVARRSNSKMPRTNGKPFVGNVGDPWAPVQKKEPGKSFTLRNPRGFTYRQLFKLLFSGNWKRPFLADHAPDETGEMVLIAEAFVGGQSTTEGFHSRRIAIPKPPFLVSDTAARIAKQQVEEIKAFDIALQDALGLVAAGGERGKVESKHYQRTQPARGHFQRRADRLFFAELWKRVAAKQEGGGKSLVQVRLDFLQVLFRAAKMEFDSALPSIPCPSSVRLRAEVRARGKFHDRVWQCFPELFESENPIGMD